MANAGVQIAGGGGRGGEFQGLIYATKNIAITQGGRMQGPMISLDEVSLGQTGLLDFPPVSILPGGSPGPLPAAVLFPPEEFGG